MESETADSVAERVRLVLENIRRATERAGRHPDRVRLVAATKTVSVERIQEGIKAGVSILGENRMQEGLAKMERLKAAPVRWHFIGQLQRRKVRSVIGLFDVIHSVDSVELAQEIDRRAGEAGITQTILLEVNMGGESTKAGFHPEEIQRQIPTLGAMPHLRIQGLMTIPPPTLDPEQARSYFRGLRELAVRIADQRVSSVTMQELSMGMSHDYEVAIEEGATLVRVGTAIFGARHA